MKTNMPVGKVKELNKKIKIGVIGTGSISKEHIESYLKHPDVELYALCDIDPERLTAAAGKYGVSRAFTEAEEMLKLPELDAVSVCTWNAAHAPCTIAALNAGKHVLCEKPMALNACQAEEMRQASLRSRKLMMIGFVRRFGNDCAMLREQLEEGLFGELYYAKAQYLRRKGSPGGWFGDFSRSGGGPLIDLGVHVIDLVRYLMGNPKPVSVYGATFSKLGERNELKDPIAYRSASATDHDVFDVEDFASALIRFDNNAVLSVETSYSLNIEKDVGKIELFGTKAGAVLDPEVKIYGAYGGRMADITFPSKTALSFDGLFQQEINHFVSCVKTGSDSIAPASDGVEMMRILDAIYESARTGHEVLLE